MTLFGNQQPVYPSFQPPEGSPQAGAEGQQTAPDQAPAKPGDVPVHVMPGKFRIGSSPQGGNKGNRGLIFLIVVLAVVLLGGGAFAYFRFFAPASNTNLSTNSLTNSAGNVNVNVNTNSSTNTNSAGNVNINVADPTTNTSTPTIVKNQVVDPATNAVTSSATLTVPSGALPSTVKVVNMTSLASSIGAYATSKNYQAIGGVYIITPSGVKLSKKAAMELTYTDQELLGLSFAVKEETITAARWDGTDWTPMNTLLDKNKNIATIEIDEFATDGIALVLQKPAPTNTNTSSNTNTGIVPTLDSDADGLTNQEEVLYGTNAGSADTDGDGFHDGQEVLARYNPNGAGKLEVNAGIKLHHNTTYSYSLLFPTTWAVGTLNSDKLITFTSMTGEFVQVSIQENSSGLSAREWYLSLNPSAGQSTLKDIASGTLTGVLGPDGLNAYFADTKYIYHVTYNIGIKNEANYLTTFIMMYSSLLTGAVTSSTNANANTNTNTNTSAANTNTPPANTTAPSAFLRLPVEKASGSPHV